MNDSIIIDDIGSIFVDLFSDYSVMVCAEDEKSVRVLCQSRLCGRMQTRGVAQNNSDVSLYRCQLTSKVRVEVFQCIEYALGSQTNTLLL